MNLIMTYLMAEILAELFFFLGNYISGSDTYNEA